MMKRITASLAKEEAPHEAESAPQRPKLLTRAVTRPETMLVVMSNTTPHLSLGEVRRLVEFNP